MMNRCEELHVLIEEGYKLKDSASLSWFTNAFGQMMQLPTINEAELIKWNTKIDLFFRKTNSPIRNLKREEFPNHNIIQYMEIKLKTMEGLLETWRNEEIQEDTLISENIEVSILKQEKQKRIEWSTIGTWVGVLVAIIALIWGIYTYFASNNAPTNYIAEQTTSPINVNGSNNTVILQQNQDNN